MIFFIGVIVCTSSIYGEPQKVDKFSKASILIDQNTNRVLYEKEPDAKRPLASLSKMMTFLLAIEAIENKEVNANDIIEIDKSIAAVRGSSYHLKEGEKIPLKELMKGLMIVSGNDAAIAIARHIDKDEKVFVERMNKKATQIGMINTHFVNPHGLPIYDLKELLLKVAILLGVLIVIYAVFWLLTELGLIPRIIFAVVPQIVLLVIGIFIIFYAYSKLKMR